MKTYMGYFLILACLFSGCINNAASRREKEITVVSREEGSGTRGAFIELFGVEESGTDGKKKDMTTKEAVIAKQTDVMMTNIATDPYAIGYISLGSLNDTVKALQIGDTDATADNVKNGSYPISRPFNIATKGTPDGLCEDFIRFILSKEGQEVVAKSYIAVYDNAPAFVSEKQSGKIVIAGSTSVAPVMEKLKEAYLLLNTNAAIEIQQSDSSAGMTSVMDGTCDIGMSSRALKESEAAQLTATKIAIDGIAVIVNKENTVMNLEKEDIKHIFTGQLTTWSAFVK